jgi:large-conductance mechanosensitive channel
MITIPNEFKLVLAIGVVLGLAYSYAIVSKFIKKVIEWYKYR